MKNFLFIIFLVVASCNDLPQTADGYQEVVDSLKVNSRKEEAIYTSHKLLGESDFDSLINYNLAELHSSISQYDSAIYYYSKSDLNDQNILFHITNNFILGSKYDSAYKYIDKYYNRFKGSSYGLDMNIIKVLIENSKFKRAIDFYHFVEKFYWSKSIMYNYGCFTDEHQYSKYMLLSRCYLGLDSLEKAKTTLNQASKYSMEWEYFYFNSKYYYKIDNFQKSINYLEIAKKLNPSLDSILRLEAELERDPLDY